MIIVYIAIGIVFGLIAMIATLASGAGVLAAFSAYILVGLVGLVCGVVATQIPKRSRAEKQGAVQRS